jgi:magnesium transporter
VSARLLAPSGSLENPSREQVAERLRSGETFWLDIREPEEDDFGLLRDAFHFHDLAVEDSEMFGQRPKAEDYEDFVFLVVYGWSPDGDGLVEVHCFYTDRYLVTVHRDPSPSIDSVCAELERDHDRFPDAPRLLYEVIDNLVDDLFPVLQRLDERLDLIEENLFTAPRGTQLGDIFQMKRRLVSLRRVVAPQRDLLGRLVSGGVDLPGLNPEMERYFRDVYDHLIRLTEEIDSDRELANSAIDAYLSTASNRLNVTTKQLTVIATIFLPLSFITGFFGQNFGWMVGEVSSWQAFVLLGIGLELLTVVGLLILFRVRDWF